jgi:hypothetical protein
MENMRKEVIRLQGQIRDHLDNPRHPAATRLNNEIQALEDDLQVSKNKQSIGNRIQGIINILDGEAKRAEIMDHHHLDMFENKFEDLRNRSRNL